MSRVKDLTGQRFGRLTVIKFAGTKKGHAMWDCLCDCGKLCTTYGRMLVGGHKMSCGCLQKEVHSRKWTTHGMSRTKAYKVWEGIRWRCLNEKSNVYSSYGGRGITICDEWRDDFVAFYNYVSKLDHFGESEYSIDRIDNDGNYEPGNVRWATKEEQTRNRRVTVIVEYAGDKIPLQEAAEREGIQYCVVEQRWRKGKRDAELFKTPRKFLEKVEYHGEEMTLKDVAKKTGISYSTLFRRYKQGKRGTELFT